MEGYTNDLTAASDTLRNGYVNVPPRDDAGPAVAAAVVDTGSAAAAVQFAMHRRDELYTYMADASVQDGSVPGYTSLSGSAFVDAKTVPLGDSNEATDPEWVQRTKWNRSYQSILELPDSAEPLKT